MSTSRINGRITRPELAPFPPLPTEAGSAALNGDSCAQPEPYAVWGPAQVLAHKTDRSALLLGDGILELGELTTLGGVGGLGKTRLALQLAICQITGKEWCGLPTGGKPQRILYVSTENSVRRYQSDLNRMFTTLTESEIGRVNDHLVIVPPIAVNDVSLSMDDPRSIAKLHATLLKVAPGIIIFDPWADMVAGDENKTQDVRDTLRALQRILQASAPTAAVLIIAHARTGSSNIIQAGDNYNAGGFMRGAKALFSKVRAEIQIAPGDKDDANKLVMACGKNNDGPKFQTRGLVFNPESATYSVDPMFDLEEWRTDVSGKRGGLSVSIQDVVRIVRELAPGAGSEAQTCEITRRVESEFGVKVRTCKSRLSDALEKGYLRRGSKSGSYRLGAKPLPKG